MRLALSPPEEDFVPHPAFAATLREEATAQIVRRYARAQGWPATAIAVSAVSDPGALPLRPGFPKLLVVDLDGQADPVAAVAQLAARLGRGSRIVALGSANDVGLFRALLAAGAADYLSKPVTVEALRSAIATPCAAGIAPSQGPAGPEPGRVAVVIGVRGGVGASTVAVNTAWLLAHEMKRNTALLDLDLHYGTTALSLDLEPGRGLREALEVPDRLDPLLLTGCIVQESERLSVLGAEEAVEDRLLFDPGAVETLVRELRGTFDCVVIDLPRHLVAIQRPLLAMADTVLLVAEQSLAGIRDTVRLTRAVQAAASAAPSQLQLLNVVTRVGRERRPQIDQPTFERGIHGPVAVLVPEDGRSLAAAANQGKPLGAVARSAPVTEAMRRLAHGIGAGTPIAKPGLVARLLRRKA